MKLLLDENLSPKVAERLRRDGWDAVHVRDRGMLGAPDHEVFARAFEEDRVLVTSNVKDFEKLAQGSELHGGLICLEEAAASREEQLGLIEAALAALQGADPVNTIVYVPVEGDIELVEVPEA